MGGSTHFSKGWNEPAKLIGWDKLYLLGLGGAGAAFGVYGKAKGGNWLWLGAAALPLFVGLLVNKER